MLILSPTAYLWIKALHVIGMVAWMAGLLYLPRLFVYHAGVTPGSEASETFKVMERRLLSAIMNPAMILTFVFGGLLVAALGADEAFAMTWLDLKLVLVLGLAGMHGLMSRWRQDFAQDRNRRPASYFRVMNEVPTVLLIAIVILAVLRPF